METADAEKIAALENLGASVVRCKALDGRVDLQDLIAKLGERKIDSILLEGGGTLNDSAVRQGIVQEVITYIAPKLIGGELSKTPVGGAGVAHLSDVAILTDLQCEKIGDDWKLTGYLR